MNKNSKIVITERDPHDAEEDVIGIADTVEIANKMLLSYYGEYTVLATFDYDNPEIEYCAIIAIDGFNRRVHITFRWVAYNQI